MTDEEWREADYWDELWLEWRATLPTELDFLLAFPELVKKKRIDLQDRFKEINDEIRELKNKAVQDFRNAGWYNHLIECRQFDNAAISKELTRLNFIGKPKSKEDVYDIQKAKLFPISNLLEFRRKVAKCPWHDDNNPSLHYYEKTNTVHCFACSRGGDAIDVAMAVWNLEWKDAVTKLTN